VQREEPLPFYPVVVPLSARSRPYVLSVVTVVIAGLLRAALDRWLGRGVPYLLYYPAVTIAAWNGGFGPGVLATALAAAAAVFRYLEPVTGLTGANADASTGDVLALAIFSANGVLMALFGQR